MERGSNNDALTDRLRAARSGATLVEHLKAKILKAKNCPRPNFAWTRETPEAFVRRHTPICVGSDDNAPQSNIPGIVKRTRRPDFIAMVKRAQKAGIGIKSVNITDKSVLLTLNDDEAPAPVDATVIETADELRKLI